MFNSNVVLSIFGLLCCFSRCETLSELTVVTKMDPHKSTIGKVDRIIGSKGSGGRWA